MPSRRAADEYGRGDDGVARGRRDRGSAVRVYVRHEGRGGRGARRLGADRGWRGGRRNARRGVASPRVARARVARGEDREEDRERRRADETALRPPDRAHPAEGNPPPGAGGVRSALGEIVAGTDESRLEHVGREGAILVEAAHT